MGQDTSIGIGSGDRHLVGMRSELEALNKTKVTLKVDTDKAEAALKKVGSALDKTEERFAKTGKKVDKIKLESLKTEYRKAQREVSSLADETRQAEKETVRLSNAIGKMENRASNTKNARSEILKSLAASGATSFVENAISDASIIIGSAFGSEASTMSSSVLSGAVSGAAIGSIIPGIGTALGAMIGGGIGAIHGVIKNFEKEDDAFKSYYQDQYKSVQQTQADALTRGTAIASNREQDKVSFATILGSGEQADGFLKQLSQFAIETPFEYDALADISKTLLEIGYSQEELLPFLTKVGDTGYALGMGMNDMKYVATALGNMQTTGKTTLEYLNPLLERGIDVWKYLERLPEAAGKTREQIQEMVSKGLIPGGEAAKAIADYMGAEFAGNMDKRDKTYAGLVSNLADAQKEIDSAMGVGYNDTRKTGLQDQTDWLSGESGEEMKAAYKQIGMWKASLENLSEQYQRDALESVMTNVISDSFVESEQRGALEVLAKEYEHAMLNYKYGNKEQMEEAGATMGRILAEAEAIAQNEYNASEGAQLLLKTNKDLAENLKNDAALHGSYRSAGYEMGLKFSEGMASAVAPENRKIATYGLRLISPTNPNTITNPTKFFNFTNSPFQSTNSNTLADLTPALNTFMALPQKDITELDKAEFDRLYNKFLLDSSAKGKAYGFSYVPYNNYPALLHEGERVLTASENRSYGKGAEIKITGNSFVVREEADITKIASEIFKQMNQAYMLAQ